MSSGPLDWAVIAPYMTAVAGIGCHAGFVRPRGGWEGISPAPGAAPAREIFDATCLHTVKDYMLTAFYLCLICGLMLILSSRVYPEPLKAEAKAFVWTSWREPLQAPTSGSLFGDYRVLSGAVLLTFVLLYIWFR